MTLKSLGTACIVFAILTGSALAQQAPSFASDDEKMMYETNKDMMGGFFTDETMTSLKTDDELKSAFSAMDAASQAGMKSACEKAAANRGSYGTVTVALCDSVMKM